MATFKLIIEKIVDTNDFDDPDEFHDAIMNEELGSINVICEADDKEYVPLRINQITVIELNDDGTPANQK
jgi:hypothetical protein